MMTKDITLLTATFNDSRVIQTRKQHNTAVISLCVMWYFLFPFGQPFVVPTLFVNDMPYTTAASIPLTGNDATFSPAQAPPHAAAFNEVFSTGIGSTQCLIFFCAPVGYKTPFHSMEYQT